jgi:hypothetical protein
MRHVETISGMGADKRMIEGVNPTMIYCKNFGKCLNAPTAQQ